MEKWLGNMGNWLRNIEKWLKNYTYIWLAVCLVVAFGSLGMNFVLYDRVNDYEASFNANVDIYNKNDEALQSQINLLRETLNSNASLTDKNNSMLEANDNSLQAQIDLLTETVNANSALVEQAIAELNNQ